MAVDQQEQKAKRIVRRYDQLRGLRGNWEDHWQDVSDLVLPNRDFARGHTPGEQRRQFIYDSTAPHAAERLAGSLQGLLANPALIWFFLRTADDEINEDEEARRWLSEVSWRLLWLFNTPKFGFYTALHEVLLDLVCFGTSVLRNQNTTAELVYEPMPLGCSFFDEDSEGRVDTLYRDFEFSAQQAAEAFGLSNLPDKIATAVKEARFEEKFTFIQAIMPRRERNALSVKSTDKPWASIVVAKQSQEIVRESGFDDFPFIVSRWSKMGGEMHGRSPAMSVLPTIKMVNAMSRTLIISAEKQADPPLLIPDDGFIAPFRTQPGGLNYFRAGSKTLPQPLVNNARTDINFELINQQREVIQRSFYLDMFELPIIDRMTATEVQQRQREKQQTLNPILARLHRELLTPVVDRAFNALVRAKAVPEVPEVLAGRDLQIEFQSPLALAQRASESAGFTQWLALMAPIFEVDPTAMMNLNPDEVAHWAKGMFNVPQRVFRTREEVEQMRQELQERQQQQEQAALAQQGAAALKDVAGASQQLETLDALAG